MCGDGGSRGLLIQEADYKGMFVLLKWNTTLKQALLMLQSFPDNTMVNFSLVQKSTSQIPAVAAFH